MLPKTQMDWIFSAVNAENIDCKKTEPSSGGTSNNGNGNNGTSNNGNNKPPKPGDNENKNSTTKKSAAGKNTGVHFGVMVFIPILFMDCFGM